MFFPFLNSCWAYNNNGFLSLSLSRHKTALIFLLSVPLKL